MYCPKWGEEQFRAQNIYRDDAALNIQELRWWIGLSAIFLMQAPISARVPIRYSGNVCVNGNCL